MKRIIVACFAVLISASAIAAELPSQTEVKKVFDFYYYGQGKGVVLIDAKFCRGVHKEGEEKNNCKDDLTGQTVAAGEEIYLWMAYIVPKGDDKQNIIIQLYQGTIPRNMKTLQVSGALRYRTWRKYTVKKPGTWSVRIRHDKGENAPLLGTTMITVVKKEEE